MIRFSADPEMITAEAGDETRPARIAGLAVPWNTVATVADGQRVQFSPGSFDVTQKPAKLVENHDLTQLRGLVTSLTETDEGLEFEATLADTRASRDAVALLKAGAYDSVSVGAHPITFTTDPAGVKTVTEARLVELSLVAVPAYEEAVITQVAATAPDPDHSEEEQEMSDASPAAPVEAPVTIPTEPIYATARTHVPIPTAPEYIAAFIAGGSAWDRMHEALRAAAPNILTTDTPGLLPIPVLAPVYNNFQGRRPVVDAVGVRAMPGGGKVFIRPEVTTHTSMAVQSAENATLEAGTLVVTDNQITKAAYGGYVTLSEQDIDWTDPNILAIVLDDMGRIYANTTDNVAADALVAGASVTGAFGAAVATSSALWAAWVPASAQTILSGSNGNLPTHMFLSPNIWGALIGLVDSQNRPLFPAVGPMNAYGNLLPGQPNGVAFGLNVVVDRNFATNTLIIGDPRGFEIYEQQKGAISVDVPSTLSRTLSFRGYFATLMLDPSMFVRATFA